MSLLKAENISHSYDYKLFSDINLDVKSGDTISIVGSSGSGKSTLLSILGGLLSPNSGKITVLNSDLYKDKKDLLNIRRDILGTIFQSHYLFRGFSVLENLQLVSYISNKDIDYDLLDRLNIKHLLNQKVSSLSGGQKQRVSIARVLLKKPNIVFADEPTGNLDYNRAKDVIDILLEYTKEIKERALVLITHDSDIAKRCNYLYNLKDYKLIRA